MRHLYRLGALLITILLVIFVAPRVMPIPPFLTDYGFHPKNIEEDMEKWASLPLQFVSSSICNDCH